MSVILKYSLLDGLGLLNEKVILRLPAEAVVLSVQLQGSVPTIWVSADKIPDGQGFFRTRIFNIVATGGSVDLATNNYVGTIQFSGGRFVFHVFEQTEAATNVVAVLPGE